jgi:multidrug efflux pump subunit AcrA (membrane-fusion protein)
MDYRKLLLSLMLGLTLLAAGCSATEEIPETAEPEPQENFSPTISVTGVVVPARWAALSVNTGGVVQELFVEEGFQVEAGESLLQLSGEEQLQAALTAARLEQISARQSLDDVYDNSVLLTSQGQFALANAQDHLDDTEYHWQVQQQGYRANGEVIARAEANLVLADSQVEQAESLYNRYSGRPKDDPERASARAALANARLQRESIERNLNWYVGHPSELEQAVLDAELALAEAQIVIAEQEYRLVESGANPELVELARARLESAEAAVAAAEKALADNSLAAPYSGMVTTVHVRENEWVGPGQPLMLIADLSTLQIETTDLSEIDVPQVAVGAPVVVFFDALPELMINGTVTRIAQKASEGAGVNYTVIVELETIPEQIRWGMTAFLDIEIVPGG